MSDGRRKPVYAGDDRRTGDALHEHEAFYDLFVDFIQGGLAQFAFLSAPALWFVAATPVYTVEVATAAGSTLVLVPFLLTMARGGHLPLDRSWPVLTNRRLGTTGWRAFLTRSVYLSSTLLLATVGGVLAQVVSGAPLANVLVAGTLSAAALAALPSLSGSSRRVRIARFSYCVLGIAAAIAVFVLPSGTDSTGALAVVLVLVLAVVDTRPLAAATRR